jgi:hypothetical protein
MRQLVAPQHAAELIRAGKTLLLAGDAAVLAKMPPGKWIGGTIPYFVTEKGGCCVRDQVFVDVLDAPADRVRIARYAPEALGRIYRDARPDAVRFIIIPALSKAHLDFALGAPTYDGFASIPLLGWIAGVHLDDLGKVAPLVFDGTDASAIGDAAVVLEMALPAGVAPTLGIVNPFEPDLAGPEIRFTKAGFSAATALVDGKEVDFPAFLRARAHEARFPLVADYCGAGVNVSFQAILADKVDLYAPVFPDITYRLAKPLADYRATLARDLDREWKSTSFNCILNYLYGELEGKPIGSASYPCTFGEIAYQLLNQTFVHLDLTETK